MDESKVHGLDELMKNDEEMSDLSTQDIRKRLSKPLQELHDLEEELKGLDERRTQIEAKRTQLQEQLAQYDFVFSPPICRLPTDVLHEIFLHCLPTRRNPIMSAKEAPLLLTRICKAWRQTAYASPRLWARLYITFSNEDMIPVLETEHGLTKQYISNLLRLRCNAVQEWLSRSGACPLSISLHYTIYEQYANVVLPRKESVITSELFRILAQFSNRWEDLELTMPMDMYRQLEFLVPLSQLSMLKFLKLSLLGRDIAGDVKITLLQAQNLTRISFIVCPTLKSFYANPTPNPSLTKLTTLSCHGSISVSQARSLLQACPSLQYLTLSPIPDPQTVTLFGPLAGVQAPKIHSGPVSLPHLRAFSFSDVVNRDPVSGFYDQIDAPRLEWISIVLTRLAGPNYTTIREPKEIAALLSRSRGLKKLTIEANILPTTILRKMLSSAESITHLVFGPEKRANNNNLLSSSNMFEFGLATTNLPYNIGDLFLKAPEEGSEENPASTFLPNLEILEISDKASKQLKDDTLRDIILCRTDPLICKDTTFLKEVTVLFNRRQELDVSKEISAHSEDNGRPIKLDLRYHASKILYFTSPRYGVDSFDRSWSSREIADEMLF